MRKKIFGLIFIFFSILQSINAENLEGVNTMNGKSKQEIGLKGNWKVIGCQLNGVWLPTVIFEYFVYAFPDLTHFTLAWSDLSFGKYAGGFPKSDQGTIVLNTKESPNTIDLVPATGPFAGQTFKGIFELDHDILKANFGLPGNERPKEFTAKQGQVYEIWQRL